jgi:hypothetical protein
LLPSSRLSSPRRRTRGASLVASPACASTAGGAVPHRPARARAAGAWRTPVAGTTPAVPARALRVAGSRRATSAPRIAGSAVPPPVVRIPSRGPWAALLVRPRSPAPRLGLRASRPGRSPGPAATLAARGRLAGTASPTPPVVGVAVAAPGAGRCHVDQGTCAPTTTGVRQYAKKAAPEGDLLLGEIRRRPTLPGSLLPSTIGAGGLNFRVRYGNGCDPSAMATEICCQLRSARPGAGPLRTP